MALTPKIKACIMMSAPVVNAGLALVLRMQITPITANRNCRVDKQLSLWLKLWFLAEYGFLLRSLYLLLYMAAAPELADAMVNAKNRCGL